MKKVIFDMDGLMNLKDANIFDYFSVVVCGDMINKSKPEPEIYLKACELLQEKPEAC